MPQYGKVGRVALAISLLRLHVHDETLDSVLDALADAIAAAGGRLHEAFASEDLDPDYITVVEDSECAIVEALLGTAFVACQTRITAIQASARDVYAALEPARQSKLPPMDSKNSVLALGQPLGGSTDVAVINAVANYFKHNDEWSNPGNWSKLTGQSKTTADTIASIGLSSGSTGNLRRAAGVFGWDASGNSIHSITTPITAWGEKLLGLLHKV